MVLSPDMFDVAIEALEDARVEYNARQLVAAPAALISIAATMLRIAGSLDRIEKHFEDDDIRYVLTDKGRASLADVEQ